MRYEIDDCSYFIYELIYDNNYGTLWKVEESKDLFKNINNKKETKKEVLKFLKEGSDYFNLIDFLNESKTIRFIKKGASEYIYGTNSNKLNKKELMLKMRIAPSIDDLIKNASIFYYSPLIHKNKLFINGFNNYQGIVCIDENVFRYLVRIGITKLNDSCFYDVSLKKIGVLKRNQTS